MPARASDPTTPSPAEPAGVADAHRRPEAALDVDVGLAEDAIELALVDGADRQVPGEEDGVLGPDGEGHRVEGEVAAQQVLEERGVVLLGRGHDVGLELEGALADGQPER